ncbi:MAG TPA: hypothetical protein DHU96_00905 [Actinobacteria bacterium]|nr:hypothetical protein [Actinomycetota bacterium]
MVPSGPRPVGVRSRRSRATTITSGAGQSCVLHFGKAWCWGYNAYGELGDGTTTNPPVPVPVDTSGAMAGRTLMQISAGATHTCGSRPPARPGAEG